MKSIFLDYATVGPGLDTNPLSDLLPRLETFNTTDNDQLLDRIRDAEFVFANKIRLYDGLFDAARKLRFILQIDVDVFPRIDGDSINGSTKTESQRTMEKSLYLAAKVLRILKTLQLNVSADQKFLTWIFCTSFSSCSL